MAPTLQSHLTLFLLCPYISSCKDSFTLDVQSIASSSTINIKSSPPSFPLVTPNKVLRSNFYFSPIMLSCLKSLVVPIVFGSFPGGSVVKSMPANAGDVGSIPGSGRSPEEEMANPSSILAWKIPWTEEPGRLQSTGSRRVGHD